MRILTALAHPDPVLSATTSAVCAGTRQLWGNPNWHRCQPVGNGAPIEASSIRGHVNLIVSSNSWHWVDPAAGVKRLCGYLNRVAS
jgi:hypothetical protein